MSRKSLYSTKKCPFLHIEANFIEDKSQISQNSQKQSLLFFSLNLEILNLLVQAMKII